MCVGLDSKDQLELCFSYLKFVCDRAARQRIVNASLCFLRGDGLENCDTRRKRGHCYAVETVIVVVVQSK